MNNQITVKNIHYGSIGEEGGLPQGIHRKEGLSNSKQGQGILPHTLIVS